MKRITIEKDKCLGCGMCEYTVPAIFLLEDFVSSVRVAPITEEEFSSVYLKTAVEDCPAGAIKIEE